MQDILRSLRVKNNYSQNAVAEYLDISRQMYNKYENGSAEPSLRNIRKLCRLYNVSADIFLQQLSEKQENPSVSYPSLDDDNFSAEAASPECTYGSYPGKRNGDGNNLLDEMTSLLPMLHFNEQVSLMARLADIIEKRASAYETPAIKQKKLRKIPDAAYNSYLEEEGLRKIRNTRLSSIREMLKNDEW